MGAGVRSLQTTYTTLTGSPSGRSVTKTRDRADDARRRFRYELRINQLLRDKPPPVRTPLLLEHDVTRRSLTFEAVPGEPLGPKYPHDLGLGEVDEMLELAECVRGFDPRRRRWFRRLDTGRRLALAHRHGLLTSEQTTLLQQLARRVHVRHRFCHGDITARNVLRDEADGACVLIDWEWAGLHPAGYDHAFLWFSLVDTPGGRDRVEAAGCGVAEESFLLSALLVQLWHLQWFTPQAFREAHLATRDELLQRLGA